jgi:hypothetical protein
MADVPPSASPTTTKKRKTETTTALLRRNNRLDDLERDEAAPPMTPETDDTTNAKDESEVGDPRVKLYIHIYKALPGVLPVAACIDPIIVDINSNARDIDSIRAPFLFQSIQ